MIPSGLIEALTTTATVIGFCVMFAWTITIVWLISVTIGEFRFNRILKKRAERDYDNLRSSWLLEMQDLPSDEDGPDRTDTNEYHAVRHPTAEIHHLNFHHEDRYDTEETGAVFDIRERYPNEFV